MFSALRLVGIVVVLVGAVQLTRAALHGVGETEREYDQLREAEEGLAWLAERDHELRNGIAGLAGAAGALSDGPAEHDQAELRSAVSAEIARLAALLRGPVAGGPVGATAEAATDEPAPSPDRQGTTRNEP